MIRRVLAACLLSVLCTRIALAQTAEDFTDALHVEHVAVRLDGVQVAESATVYLADDETIYVSEADLAAWGLKYPLTSAFSRNGLDYFGLQTDLNLATSYSRAENELEVVAPRSAFIGQPKYELPPLTPGTGTFLNYDLKREYGSYDFFQTLGGGTFEYRELSTAGANGLDFFRSRTRVFWLNSGSHTVLQLGDTTTNPGWLGTAASFAGVHFASDFTSDPTYVSREPPSVTGVATSPSLLEVYIENLLVLRRYVPQGPFTIRDLPASAANSDIVLVLTDQNGVETTLVERPSYDPSFLSPGRSTFSIDAGLAHEFVDTPNSYYRGAVLTGTMRYGLTKFLTGEFYGESINRENFIDAGADLQLAKDATLGFRLGGGNMRHASKYECNVSSGKFHFREELMFNSETQPPFEGLDFGDVVEQISDATELGIDASDRLQYSLRLNRSRDSTGSNYSMLSAQMQFRMGPVRLEIGPLYDFVARRASGSVMLSATFSENHRVMERTEVTSQGQVSSALEYRKDTSDPSDPLSLEAKYAFKPSQDRLLGVTYDMPWAIASFEFQQLYGSSIYEPQITGAFAFVDDRFYALRTVSESEAFGVLNLPVSNARVSVNSSEIGRTDAQGDIVLRNLGAFRDNVITTSTEDLPIYVNLSNPQHVVPAKTKPVNLRARVISRGGLTINLVDEQGTPLAPASMLTSPDGREFPIGYDGRAYLSGLSAGTNVLFGTSGAGPCKVTLDVPQNLDAIPDLGTQVCR